MAEKQCPECTEELHPVRIIDKNVAMAVGMQEPELQYALPGAKPGKWRGLPLAGRVAGFMCSNCGRLLLYGVPKDS